MIKLFLVGILICFNSWAKVSLVMELNHNQVKQGEIVEGRLIVKHTEGQAALGGLKGKNVAKTLYLLNVSPFMVKQGQLESEAKVIFLAVPQTSSITETVNGEEVSISWEGIEILPTEESKSFLLGDFTVPEARQILKWILFIAAPLLLIGVFVWFMKTSKRRRLFKDQIAQLKKELTGCGTYDEIVLMWRNKRRYLEAFPGLDTVFKNFEDVLFKHQFKPSRTSLETDEVLTSYKKFIVEASAVINEK